MPTGARGDFVWYDLLTPDPEAAAAYYRQVVGWTSQPFPGSDVAYTMFAGAEGPMAGTTKPEASGVRPQWVANVYVDDVDQTAALATELGGRLFGPPADYPGIGRLAVVADREGAPLNIFKPSQPLPLRDPTKPGAFTWSELMTPDPEAAFDYYSRLFGWKKQRALDRGPMGQYLVYGQGERELGGMFTKDKEAPLPPAAWIHYVRVTDLDAAVARALAGGGTSRNGPMEAPDGGRIAQLTDPQGAFFALRG